MVITAYTLVSLRASILVLFSDLKTKYFNPGTLLQKAGHGSYVETSLGEVYLVHLCSRPFVPELRCTLGRETAMQKMYWTGDGWLRMADGTNIAKEFYEESALEDYPVCQIPSFDGFDSGTLGNFDTAGLEVKTGFFGSPSYLPHTFLERPIVTQWLYPVPPSAHII